MTDGGLDTIRTPLVSTNITSPWYHALTFRVAVFEILKVNLSRPFVLTFTEPILWFWDAYIAVRLLSLLSPAPLVPYVPQFYRKWAFLHPVRD
jgi:hypothetical protein